MRKSNRDTEFKLLKDYQARLVTPFAVLGIRTEEDWLTDIDYLPLDTPSLAPTNQLAEEVCKQLLAYLANPAFVFLICHFILAVPCISSVCGMLFNVSPVVQPAATPILRISSIQHHVQLGKRVALIAFLLSFPAIVSLQKMAVWEDSCTRVMACR